MTARLALLATLAALGLWLARRAIGDRMARAGFALRRQARADRLARRHREPDQRYYWTPEWQASERESRRELVNGGGVRFATARAAARWLEEDDGVQADVGLPGIGR